MQIENSVIVLILQKSKQSPKQISDISHKIKNILTNYFNKVIGQRKIKRVRVENRGIICVMKMDIAFPRSCLFVTTLLNNVNVWTQLLSTHLN